MHKKIFLLLLASALTFSAYPENIKLKSGKVVEAKIIEKTDDTIKVDISGVLITYYLNEIESIDGKIIDISKKHPISQMSATKSPQEIFETVSPAIVYITAKISNGEQYLGSGFIIDSQGIVVTNHHLVGFNRDILVKLKDGKVYPTGNIFIQSIEKDICIFTIKSHDLPALALGDSQAVKIGDTIYCIGNPLGLEYSFSNGMLSGIRNVSGTLYPNVRFLQFTAPVSPGNSGGPLLDSQGYAIGIVTTGVDSGQNLNFALAIDEAYGEIGGMYILLKQYQQAIPCYQKAIQSDSSNPALYSFLGLAYAKLGKYSEAKTNYLRAKELFQAQGDSEGIKNIEEYLKEIP